MQVKSVDVMKTVEKAGWVEVRCKGSHHQYKNPTCGQVVTIPCRRTSEVLSPNVIKQLEKATGLSFRR